MKVLWASRRLLRADPASGIIAWGSCSQLAAKSLDSTLKLESAAEIIPERHDESSKAIVDTAPHDATAAFPHGCLSSSAQHYHNRGLSGVRQNSAASQQLRHLWSAHLRSKTPSDMSIQPAHLCSQNWATSGLPPCIRGLSTETIQDRVSQANSILQTLDILRFRERLEMESERTQRMSSAELIALCKESGAAKSDEEAERVCEALKNAGIVLRVGDMVYLKPEEVVEIILRAVPDTEEEIQARLKELEAEIQPLAEQKRKIENRTFRRTHGVLWMGLGFLVLQWGIFLHFTYSELSWDVVEPVTYFTSQLWAILGYCYFLATKEDFAYRHAHSKMTQNFRVGGEKDHAFNRARYERLLQEYSRYQRYLHIPAAEAP